MDGQAPRLFYTNGKLSRMANGKILGLTPGGLWELLTRNAVWKRPKGKELVNSNPDKDALAEAVGASVDYQDLPELNTIVSSMLVLPDGTVVDGPGYFEELGLLSRVPQLDPPTPAEALGVIKDAFGEFKYANEQAKANAMGALFTVPLRFHSPDILPPLFAVSKARGGAGASTLLEAIAWLVTGEKMKSTGWNDDPAEMDKRLASRFRAGDSCILFDNVIKACESPSISTLITSGTTEVRLLGGNKMVRNHGPVTLFLSSNAAELGEDYADRTCQIELTLSQPRAQGADLSAEFTHHPYLPWLRENLERVLSAMVTILREALWLFPDIPKGRSRLPVWERYANAVCAALGLQPVQIGIQAGGSLSTDAELKNDIINIMAAHAADRIYTRDDFLKLLAAHLDIGRVPGVREITESNYLFTESTVSFRSPEKCGKFLSTMVKGKWAVDLPDGRIAYLHADDQSGARKCFLLIRHGK